MSSHWANSLNVRKFYKVHSASANSICLCFIHFFTSESLNTLFVIVNFLKFMRIEKNNRFFRKNNISIQFFGFLNWIFTLSPSDSFWILKIKYFHHQYFFLSSVEMISLKEAGDKPNNFTFKTRGEISEIYSEKSYVKCEICDKKVKDDGFCSNCQFNNASNIHSLLLKVSKDFRWK